jgi:hypothetical protein
MSHPIFCQACFESTHDPTKSVWEVDTNGRCSKCGSNAVLDARVVASIAAQRLEENRQIEMEKRKIPYNTDILRSEDIREFLRNHDGEAERWWDGTYFEYHLWFLLVGSITNSFELLLENKDGKQRTVALSVEFKLEVSSINA